MLVVVVEPGAGDAHHFFHQGGEYAAGVGHGVDDIAICAGHPKARRDKAQQQSRAGHAHGESGALLCLILGAVCQIGGALQRDQRYAHQPKQQGHGVEQPQQIAAVGRAHGVVDAEGHAVKQIAKCHAKNQGGYGAADKQAPIPHLAPNGVGEFGAKREPDRPKEQGKQHQHQRGVHARKSRGIDKRPGGKNGAPRRDEPHLVALPMRGHGVDHDAALRVIAPHEGQQNANAHVVAVHHGKADEQKADQQPPDQLEREIVQHGRWLLSGVVRLQGRGAHAGIFQHQVNFYHQQHGVKNHKAGQRSPQCASRYAGG